MSIVLSFARHDWRWFGRSGSVIALAGWVPGLALRLLLTIFAKSGKFGEMTRMLRLSLCLAASAVLSTVTQSYAQTRDTELAIVVDKIVANPEEFKDTINVIGRVAKLRSTNNLFALSCEDECFSMPVRFSGTAPKPGSDVIVRGQLAKESDGRYVFNAESVMPKK